MIVERLFNMIHYCCVPTCGSHSIMIGISMVRVTKHKKMQKRWIHKMHFAFIALFVSSAKNVGTYVYIPSVRHLGQNPFVQKTKLVFAVRHFGKFPNFSST
jgi:hypothetical protein